MGWIGKTKLHHLTYNFMNKPAEIMPKHRTTFHVFYFDARVQKFKRNEGETVNQLINAMAVAVSNLAQWFCAQSFRSLPIRTVIPADAQAAANVRVEVICSGKQRVNIGRENNVSGLQINETDYHMQKTSVYISYDCLMSLRKKTFSLMTF